MKKRKRRLMKVDQRIVLPLSDEFVAALALKEGAIVEIDEERLAQAIRELSKEDILHEVLQRALVE
ncbi:hypothetical protein UAS_02402 [Enterococcus asini ATCC 700915]|uniref:Uncharacterized protein n=1 Tax=Enterococcus asini ATCC 700915 TaxID=1158606 RepID=R2PG44_9ENTE|nr:hypothetical protein [Enterococcus asini]EOH83387.1 hypothetical protein UAS_02402 [Enterococcus asini ATCC 700915]EOT57187.1 hypothetical protein I579_00725 [Enterococcus asini ATCC 700915]MDT2744805.1 hypothetical protein [Enterococcus asini]